MWLVDLRIDDRRDKLSKLEELQDLEDLMADDSIAEPLAMDETKGVEEEQTLPRSAGDEAKQPEVASASEEPDLDALLDGEFSML